MPLALWLCNSMLIAPPLLLCALGNLLLCCLYLSAVALVSSRSPYHTPPTNSAYETYSCALALNTFVCWRFLNLYFKPRSLFCTSDMLNSLLGNSLYMANQLWHVHYWTCHLSKPADLPVFCSWKVQCSTPCQTRSLAVSLDSSISLLCQSSSSPKFLLIPPLK